MATAATTSTPNSLLLQCPNPAKAGSSSLRIPARAAKISCTAIVAPSLSSPAVGAAERGIYSFVASPATLPLSVLEKAQAELVDYRGSCVSIMEMSHHGKEFDAAIKKAEADLCALLVMPDTHAVLFLQGGATTQFAAVPLNLCASLSDPTDSLAMEKAEGGEEAARPSADGGGGG